MKIFGGILIAIGILIAGASGLCSIAILMDSGEFAGPDMWPLVLMIGGIPGALGIGMVFGGRALIRSAARREDELGGGAANG